MCKGSRQSPGSLAAITDTIINIKAVNFPSINEPFVQTIVDLIVIALAQHNNKKSQLYINVLDQIGYSRKGV
jgi:hypothetical protein